MEINRIVVVAFDPGDSTGWSWVNVSAEELLTGGLRGALNGRSSSSWDCGQWDWEGSGEGSLSGASIGRVRWENVTCSRMKDLCRQVWVDSDVDSESDIFVAVVEKFTLRMMDMGPSLLSPVRITAKFEYAMEGSGVRVDSTQQPVDAFRSITDERLARWGMLAEGRKEDVVHARDATRHALLWLRRYASDPRLRRVRPGLMAH